MKKLFTKSELLEEANKTLKNEGFKKSSNTWTKETDKMFLFFNVQTSQYDSEYFYINVGLSIKEVLKGGKLSILTANIFERIEYENKTLEKTMTESLAWYDNYDSIKKIKEAYLNNKIFPRMGLATYLDEINNEEM